MTAQDAVVCVPVTPDGQVEGRWGKAPRVAVATVSSGEITGWIEHDVRWDVLHDEGTEGSHHARVVRFLRDNEVTAVVASHMGPPMANTISKLGLGLHLSASGDARDAVLRALAAN